MEKHKTCSFIGHRKIDINDNLEQRVKECVENLITKSKVQFFLFGSKSVFNDLCHTIVSQLKEKYPYVKRVCYTCKSEGCTLEEERKEREKVYSHILNQEVRLLGYEEEYKHKTKDKAGRASYVERNYAMIDDSSFCVFYYDKNYLPSTKTKSGTKIAYQYAVSKNKKIINLFN